MFWVTAGHVVQEMEKLKELATTRFVGAQWLDHHPKEEAEAAPTSLEHLDMTRIEEHGTDFGLVKIPEFDCRILCGNPEIEPLNSNAWRGRESAAPEAFFVVGSPKEWSGFKDTPSRSGVNASVDAILAPVQIEPIQDRRGATPKGFWGCPNSIYARVLSCEHDDGRRLESIVGTSGGAIFGVKPDATNRFRYWWYGVQSSWLPNERILRATRIDSFASAFERFATLAR